MAANYNTKKVKLFLMGSSGKMGRMISELAKDDPEIVLCENSDVVIDFSSPEGTLSAIALGKPLVCGTTGLSSEIFSKLEDLSKKVPVIYSPNFSIGINLCFEILEKFGEKLKRFGDIEIKEIHHTQKKDSPSGTAIKMSELLGVDEILSKREGANVGTHQVNCEFGDETLSIKHEAHSRKAFAQGAITAAKFIFNRPAKMYSFKDVLSR